MDQHDLVYIQFLKRKRSLTLRLVGWLWPWEIQQLIITPLLEVSPFTTNLYAIQEECLWLLMSELRDTAMA